MEEKKELKIDWIYLPPESEEISLWSCLHDGELVLCTSDRDRSTVDLEFFIGHLAADQDDLWFRISIDGVTSVRANVSLRPMEKYTEPDNISPEQRAESLGAYYARWREESLSWPEFESALATDPLQISEAAYASSNGETALRLGGFLDGEKFDDIYCAVFMRGRSVSASRSDGKNFSLEAFIEMGQSYWENL